MPKGHTDIVRTCPRCGDSGPPGGMGTHIRYCGKQEELLWARINKDGPNGCWVYSGASDRRGYGRPATWASGRLKRYYAHRRVYELLVGPIPEGKLVLHRCDNPPCCNPEHLFLGDDRANHADKVAKKRHTWGELTKRNKLSASQALEVLRAAPRGPYAAEMARALGVSVGTIQSIVARRSWKELSASSKDKEGT